MTDLRKAAETMLFRLLGDENHDIRLRAAIALLQTPVQSEDEERFAKDWQETVARVEAKLKEKNT